MCLLFVLIEQMMSLFPLDSKYSCHLFCISCFKESAPLKVTPSHRCHYDLLAVQDKASKKWFEVRSGHRHKSFNGEYNMCRDWKQKGCCPRGRSCLFAHGIPEVLLFTLEKDNKFDIAGFISEVRLQYSNANTCLKQVTIIGPILWRHNSPLCHALSLLLWTSMRRRHATVAACDSSDTW